MIIHKIIINLYKSYVNNILDETETESIVTSVGSGAAESARLRQTVRARCGAAAALLLRCASSAELRAARDAALLRVRDKLHNRDHLLAK